MTTSHYVSKGITNDEPESFFERWLIMPKVLYFMLNMYVYAFHGVMNLYFTEIMGFEYYQIGFASCVIAFNFFGSMLWSNLADRTGKSKLIIIVTSVLYILVACGLGLYRPEKDAEGQLAWISYILAFGGFALYNFFLSGAFPLMDAQILGNLAKNPKLSKDQFNNQRMWGAFGHFAATMCSFWCYDKHKPKEMVIFQIVVGVIFIAVVCFGIENVKPFKHGHHGGSSDKTKETSAPARNPLIVLMTNPSFIFFMLFISCSGVIRSVSSTYQKLITKEAMNRCPWLKKVDMSLTGDEAIAAKAAAERTINTLTGAVDFGRMGSEVLVYLLAKPLKEFFGVYWVLVLSQLVGILRVWGYGMIDVKKTYSFYAAFGIELLKGFSSGLVSSSAIPIASAIAPAGCESTAQGLYSGNYSGLSNLFGGLLSGFILKYYYGQRDNVTTKAVWNLIDSQKTFLWTAYICLFVTVLMMAKFIFMDRVMGLPGFPRKHSLSH